MYNLILDDIIKKKKNFIMLDSVEFYSEKKNIITDNTRFKINFKYVISILNNNKNIGFFNIKKFREFFLLKKLNKKEIFLTQHYIIIEFFKEILEIIPSKIIHLFFKNTSFIFIRYLKDFFKFFYFFNLNNYLFFLNYNFIYNLNKYFKKIKTKKKFRKKIILKEFKFDLNETYI